jgi:hypothetical protein
MDNSSKICGPYTSGTFLGKPLEIFKTYKTIASGTMLEEDRDSNFSSESTVKDPMETLDAWHKWYREHQVVASMEEPLVTKDSREQLHDTTNAVAQLVSDAEQLSFKKATEYFADTLAEFSCDLSGRQLFEALLAAATNNYNYTKGEYDKAKQFLDLISGKKEEA